jgi:anti-sigma factor RsiW
MTCEWRAQLDQYADGELQQPELLKLEAHLRSCSSCAAEALGRMQMKRSVHAAAASMYAPSADFRLKLTKSIAPPPKAAPGWFPRLAFSGVMAALLLLAGLLLISNRNRPDMLAEVVDLHVSTLASANPVDVISTDRHTVKPWFEGKLPFTFNLPELQNSEFRLIGGRMAYIDQKPAADLLFALGKHEVSVFVMQDSDGLADDVAKNMGRGKGAQRLQFNIETWAQSGLRYTVISDAARPEVQKLSDLFREAAK